MSDYSLIIRTQPAGFKEKSDPGHAGISLIDHLKNTSTHYDFGSQLLENELNPAQHKQLINSTANLARIGFMTCTTIFCAASGLIALDSPDHRLIGTTISLMAPYLYVATPTLSTLSIRPKLSQNDICNLTEISITESDYNKLTDKLSVKDRHLYSVGFNNCVHHIKRSLAAIDIKLPIRLINTPRKLEQDLRNAGYSQLLTLG